MDAILEKSKEFEHLTVKHDPLYEQLIAAIAIVKKFIIDNGLILYGGSGMDYALRLRGDNIYPDTSLAIPDLDFYSPTNVEHAYTLADILYHAGFESVRAINAKYVRTMRVDVRDGHYIADITFCPKVIFDKLPTLTYNGMKVIHPNFQRIDLHSSLSYPYDNPPKEVIFDRWSKDIKRFNILDGRYPIDDIPKADLMDLRRITVKLSMLRRYPLAGFAAYAAIVHHFRELLTQLKLRAPEFDPEPRPIEIAGAATAHSEHTDATATFATFNRTVEIVHFDMGQVAVELGVIDRQLYEPYINILPAKMTGLAKLGAGEDDDPVNLIAYSTANKLVTINVLDFSGFKLKVVNVQYLLRHFIAMSHVSEGRLKATYSHMYKTLLRMIRWVEEKISDKSFGVVGAETRGLLMKSPLFPSTYIYGRENHSLAYIVAVGRIRQELGEEVSSDITTLPWNYYPCRSIPRGMPHPVFDYEANEMFREAGAAVRHRGGVDNTYSDPLCAKPTPKFETEAQMFVRDADMKALMPILQRNAMKVGPTYIEKAVKHFNSTNKDDFMPKVLIDQIDNGLSYVPDANMVRSSTHNGQLKLFLSEVQFLTIAHGKAKYVVYAGAAPSNHTYSLLRYFPDVIFVLVDPAPFRIYPPYEPGQQSRTVGGDHVDHNIKPIDDIVYLKCQLENTKAEVADVKQDEYVDFIMKNSDRYRIFIVQDFFTSALAEQFAKLKPLFICDIRTVSIDGQPPTDTDLVWNLAMQYNWMYIMQPVMSWVKFRHPFYNDAKLIVQPYIATELKAAAERGIDFEADFEARRLKYFAGDVYIQAYAPKSSTECRLLITDHRSVKDYGTIKDFENRMFYYNNIERPFVIHINPYINRRYGFDHCGDCALASHIMECYSEKVRRIKVGEELVYQLEMLGRRIKMDGHGYLYPDSVPMVAKALNEIIDNLGKQRKKKQWTRQAIPQ